MSRIESCWVALASQVAAQRRQGDVEHAHVDRDQERGEREHREPDHSRRVAAGARSAVVSSVEVISSPSVELARALHPLHERDRPDTTSGPKKVLTSSGHGADRRREVARRRRPPLAAYGPCDPAGRARPAEVAPRPRPVRRPDCRLRGRISRRPATARSSPRSASASGAQPWWEQTDDERRERWESALAELDALDP